jgi:hypothetical protein
LCRGEALGLHAYHLGHHMRERHLRRGVPSSGSGPSRLRQRSRGHTRANRGMSATPDAKWSSPAPPLRDAGSRCASDCASAAAARTRRFSPT